MPIRGRVARLRLLLLLAALPLVAGCMTTTSPHAIVGTWSLPIDGRPGFVRRFDPDGSVRIWWPDGKLAAEGHYFVVDARTLGVDYPNHDTDVVRLIDADTIEVQHVDYNGYHRKYMARRIEQPVE